jgi:RNA polymerase sigma-70 factor (family 1)
LSQPETYVEKELLLRVSQGDEQAFASLFNAYHQHLAGYIFRLTDSTDITEEVVQEIFLKVWTNRTSLAEVNDFRAWLFKISKNHTLNCLRKLVNERVQYQEWLRVNDFQTAENEIVETNRYELLSEAIGQLPPQQQKVFVLSRIQKLKYEEIAVRMNLSRETVKSYIALAKSSITKFVSSRAPFSIISLVISLFGK